MKYIKYLLVLFIILIPIKVNALEINSKNAILYNMNDDEILFEKDSEEEVPIASLTKIMTSIIAIENIDDINETIIKIPRISTLIFVRKCLLANPAKVPIKTHNNAPTSPLNSLQNAMLARLEKKSVVIKL